MGLQSRPFGDILVEEIMVWPWKLVPTRLRPEDRMITRRKF